MRLAEPKMWHGVFHHAPHHSFLIRLAEQTAESHRTTRRSCAPCPKGTVPSQPAYLSPRIPPPTAHPQPA
eukprot:scaffold11299_cov115-Isochrysis_galbana.AAC.2